MASGYRLDRRGEVVARLDHRDQQVIHGRQCYTGLAALSG
jgi:hypothetical protein